MLAFLGEDPAGEDGERYVYAHDVILKAIELALEKGPRTPDLGGNEGAQELGRTIAELVRTIEPARSTVT